MKQLLSVMGILVLSLLLGACSGMDSWNGGDDSSSNFQADGSGGSHQRMKITRGSGYGDEVPYESKYNPA